MRSTRSTFRKSRSPITAAPFATSLLAQESTCARSARPLARGRKLVAPGRGSPPSASDRMRSAQTTSPAAICWSSWRQPNAPPAGSRVSRLPSSRKSLFAYISGDLAAIPDMLMLPKFLRKWRKRGLRPKPKTVAIFVSYPKAGRTWLRVMFDELGLPLKYTHDGMGASKQRPFEEKNHCIRSSYQKEPVIFLSRDPRDTVVSAYFHAKHRIGNY